MIRDRFIYYFLIVMIELPPTLVCGGPGAD